MMRQNKALLSFHFDSYPGRFTATASEDTEALAGHTGVGVNCVFYVTLDSLYATDGQKHLTDSRKHLYPSLRNKAAVLLWIHI